MIRSAFVVVDSGAAPCDGTGSTFDFTTRNQCRALISGHYSRGILQSVYFVSYKMLLDLFFNKSINSVNVDLLIQLIDFNQRRYLNLELALCPQSFMSI